MKLLLENWNRFLKEDFNRQKRPDPDIDAKHYKHAGKISVPNNKLEAIFKVFHVSDLRLDYDGEFEFEPRVPLGALTGEGEDNFTERVSLCSRIHQCLSAKGSYGGQLYAGDSKLTSKDDIPVVRTKVELRRCRKNIDPSYGQGHDWHDYGHDGGHGGYDLNKRFKLDKWVQDKADEDDGMAYAWNGYGSGVTPADLPEKYRRLFYACVPDAEESDELWSLGHVDLFHIGHCKNTETILSDDGVELLRHMGINLSCKN